MTKKDAIYDILNRLRSYGEDNYIYLFAADDQKKQPKRYNRAIKLKDKTNEEIKKESHHYNVSSYGTFLTFNVLSKSQRLKNNISKILYIFIDLDDAKEEHNKLIIDILKKYNITFSYNGKSGHGFHFLIPIELDSTNENKIKGFLTYLKDNVCDKVDIATYTNERLIRTPESIHNKDFEGKDLITLHTHYPNNEEIIRNSENILEYQTEHKKGIKDIEYEKSIQKKDIFFTTILENSIEWQKYYKELDKAKNRNQTFIKHLGTFALSNPDSLNLIKSFLDNWEPTRYDAMLGWLKKAKDNNHKIYYLELFKWAKENELELFKSLLLEQIKESYLDKYEFYYLEDEKPENNFLMYYPEKNYYVSKSSKEVYLNIYFDCQEAGFDLIKEYSCQDLDDWEKASFKKQLGILLACIEQQIHREKRIKKVFNINYEPTENKFCYHNKKKYFNTYNKTELWDYNKKDNTYAFPKVKELLLNLCNKKEDYYNYLNNWLAWIIKNPTEKLPTAIILQGRQGSGKGTFKNLILDNIFGDNCQEINQTHLESSFNEYLLGKQIIVANEVMHNENRQTLPNVLKNLVTDETITIQRKFKKEIVGKNFTHWFFCTNNDNPIKIDVDDRRYSVFYSEKMRKGLAKEIRENLDFELKEYISYLKTLDPDFEDISEPIMTEAKKEIIELNKDSIERFIEHIKTYSNYDEISISIFGDDKERKIYQNEDGNYYTPSESFYMLYRKWAEITKETGIYNKQNFGKKIKNFKINNSVKRIENNPIRVYNVFEIEKILMS